MISEKQAKTIIKILNKIYPKALVPLKVKIPLLFSFCSSFGTMSDINVNNVTKDIYPKYYILTFCKIR